MITWIIERPDRKLADVIGSNIVEKSDVTSSRAIQPLTSDVLASYFSSHSWQRFEVKDEGDLLLEKTVRGYKAGRGKRRSK